MKSNSDHRLNAESIGQVLRSLPTREPASSLRISLRVIASQERQRRFARRNLQAQWELWRDRFELCFDNVVRSVILPFAGGVFSTVILFSLFVPAYPLRFAGGSTGSMDVPTMLTTAVTVKGTSPFVASEGDAVVDVRVDDQGRMIDYAIIVGAGVLANAQMRRRLENMLLFTEFTPATEFGKPIPATVRLWLGSSRIEVKG